MFFTLKKKQKNPGILYHDAVHTDSRPPTKNHKGLLKQYLYLLRHSDGFFSIPFTYIPFQNMLVVIH